MNVLLRLVSLALLVKGVTSLCNPIYANQTVTSPGYAYFLYPNDESGNPATGTCTFSIANTDPFKGITGFTLSYPTSDEFNGKFTITVQNADGSYFTLPGGVNHIISKPSEAAELTNITSTSPKITITVTTSVAIALNGYVKGADTLGVITTAAPTTTRPTLPPYTGSGLHDPASISSDIQIILDSGSVAYNTTKQLDDIKTVAQSFVGNLTFAANNLTDSGSRVNLNIFTPIGGNGGLYGPIWAMEKSSFNNSLAGIHPFTQPSLYTQTLTKTILGDSGPFNVNADSPPRRWSQRILIIIATALPFDAETFFTPATFKTFTDRDVRPVFVTVGMSQADLVSFTPWTNYGFPLVQLASVTDDINNKVYNAILNGNRLCPQGPSTVNPDAPLQYNVPPSGPVGTTMAPPSSGNTVVVQEPKNYNGPAGATAVPTWSTENGQRSRYCDFQNKKYVFNQAIDDTKGKIPIVFTVYYELEVEKDTLKFFAGDQEIISFTGIDVTGSTFTVNNTVTAIFTTDNKNVYGGFRIEAASKPSS